MKQSITSVSKLALLGLTLFVSSCKHDQDTVQPGTDSGLVASFVGVRWQMASFEITPAQDIDGDGRPDSDLMKLLRPCDLDNTITFERSGKVAGDNGQLKCDDDDNPATQKPDTWTYDNATRVLRIVDGEDGSVSELPVLEASARYLKIKQTITEEGRSYAAILTMKAV